jgi:hypothetical protein
MRTLLECIAGVVAAVVSLVLIQRRRWNTQRKLMAAWLLIAALIYPALVILRGANEWLLYEFVGVVLYGLFAWMGWRVSLVALAAGWALHVCWDVLAHGAYMPAWYPMVCFGFDLALAGFIFWKWQQQKHG